MKIDVKKSCKNQYGRKKDFLNFDFNNGDGCNIEDDNVKNSVNSQLNVKKKNDSEKSCKKEYKRVEKKVDFKIDDGCDIDVDNVKDLHVNSKNRRKKEKKKERKRKQKETMKNFKVLYANCDFGLLNKKDELNARVAEEEPCIIALTEVIQKNNKDIPIGEFNFNDKFDFFMNSNPSRGTALFIDKRLKARECDEMEKTSFKESVWCTFSTKQDGKVLIGCVYRSPNNSDEENDNLLFSLLQSEEISKYNKVCVVGDVNFPFVKWDGSYSGPKGEEIKKKINDAFLFQKVADDTRRRTNQTPTLDDWVLVNDDNLVGDIEHQSPLGKSDHDLLVFEMDLSNEKETNESKYTFNLNKGNYIKLRDYLKNQNWTEMQGKNVDGMWTFLKSKILDGMEKHIPKIKRKKQEKTIANMDVPKNFKKNKEKAQTF